MAVKAVLEKQLRDWKTKYSNLKDAKDFSEYELKEEIKSLKKELVRKDEKIDSLFQMIRKLDEKVSALTAEVSALKKENAKLKETIAVKDEQILKLKARLNKDSENSDKPTSTNGFDKPIQNNREKTGRKPGRQTGHKGDGLKPFPNPTEIIEKKVTVCSNCEGHVINNSEYIAKQVVDIKIDVAIKEERVYEGVCEICGKKHRGEFSEGYVNPVQYGSGIKALVTVLNSHGFVSANKTVDIINQITNNVLNMSEATVINIQKSLSSSIANTVNDIKNRLIESKVLNADETGCRVNTKTDWIQVFSNSEFTLCGHNKKRGTASIEGMGILDYFIGILVHDHFLAYYKNSLATHAECNAHILRYLKGVIEIFNREWAREMIKHLVSIHNKKKEYMAKGIYRFTEEELSEITATYARILEQGKKEYEDSIKGKKKISYYNDERLLLKRLDEFREQHLLFAANFDVPFDNNQAERDIRPFKTKLKVSGCFRSEYGIETFARIYSLISTLRKQGMDVFRNIQSIFDGEKLSFPQSA